jgi:hypothetical protein
MSAMDWQAVLNSAIIAVVATALAMVLGSMAAFALSRYTFRGRDGLFLLFTAGLLFPRSSRSTAWTPRGSSPIPRCACSRPSIFVFAQRYLVGGLVGAIRG